MFRRSGTPAPTVGVVQKPVPITVFARNEAICIIKKVVCTPNMNFSKADCFVPRKDGNRDRLLNNTCRNG